MKKYENFSRSTSFLSIHWKLFNLSGCQKNHYKTGAIQFTWRVYNWKEIKNWSEWEKKCKPTNKSEIVSLFCCENSMFKKWLATVIFLPSPDERSAAITTALSNAAVNPLQLTSICPLKILNYSRCGAFTVNLEHNVNTIILWSWNVFKEKMTCNWTRTHNHLLRKQKLNHLAKLECRSTLKCLRDMTRT